MSIYYNVQYYVHLQHVNKSNYHHGSSCAGKSTTTNKLIHQLNTAAQSWKVLEVDDIEDDWRAKQIKYLYDDLINATIEVTNQMLASGTNIILVTNIYRPALRNIKANLIKLVLISPSHETLLEHFEKRKKSYLDQSITKTEKQLQRELRWIEESFKDFEQLSDYDVRINAPTSIQDNTQQILKHIQ